MTISVCKTKTFAITLSRWLNLNKPLRRCYTFRIKMYKYSIVYNLPRHAFNLNVLYVHFTNTLEFKNAENLFTSCIFSIKLMKQLFMLLKYYLKESTICTVKEILIVT